MLLLGKSKTKGGWKWVIEGYKNIMPTIIARERKYASRMSEQIRLQESLKQRKKRSENENIKS